MSFDYTHLWDQTHLAIAVHECESLHPSWKKISNFFDSINDIQFEPVILLPETGMLLYVRNDACMITNSMCINHCSIMCYNKEIGIT